MEASRGFIMTLVRLCPMLSTSILHTHHPINSVSSHPSLRLSVVSTHKVPLPFPSLSAIHNAPAPPPNPPPPPSPASYEPDVCVVVIGRGQQLGCRADERRPAHVPKPLGRATKPHGRVGRPTARVAGRQPARGAREEGGAHGVPPSPRAACRIGAGGVIARARAREGQGMVQPARRRVPRVAIPPARPIGGQL